MDQLTADQAKIEAHVRVRGRLRRVFSYCGRWFAQVRFASNAGEFASKVEIVPLGEVMIVPENAEHIPARPPPSAEDLANPV